MANREWGVGNLRIENGCSREVWCWGIGQAGAGEGKVGAAQPGPINCVYSARSTQRLEAGPRCTGGESGRRSFSDTLSGLAKSEQGRLSFQAPYGICKELRPRRRGCCRWDGRTGSKLFPGKPQDATLAIRSQFS